MSCLFYRPHPKPYVSPGAAGSVCFIYLCMDNRDLMRRRSGSSQLPNGTVVMASALAVLWGAPLPYYCCCCTSSSICLYTQNLYYFIFFNPSSLAAAVATCTPSEYSTPNPTRPVCLHCRFWCCSRIKG